MDLIGRRNSGAVSWRAAFDRSEKHREKCNTTSHLQYVFRNNDHKPNTLLEMFEAVNCGSKKKKKKRLVVKTLTMI